MFYHRMFTFPVGRYFRAQPGFGPPGRHDQQFRHHKQPSRSWKLAILETQLLNLILIYVASLIWGFCVLCNIKFKHFLVLASTHYATLLKRSGTRAASQTRSGQTWACLRHHRPRQTRDHSVRRVLSIPGTKAKVEVRIVF